MEKTKIYNNGLVIKEVYFENIKIYSNSVIKEVQDVATFSTKTPATGGMGSTTKVSLTYTSVSHTETTYGSMILSDGGCLIQKPIKTLVLYFTVPLKIGGYASGDSQKNNVVVYKNGTKVGSGAANISSSTTTRYVTITLTDLVVGDLITAKLEGQSGCGCNTNGKAVTMQATATLDAEVEE